MPTPLTTNWSSVQKKNLPSLYLGKATDQNFRRFGLGAAFEESTVDGPPGRSELERRVASGPAEPSRSTPKIAQDRAAQAKVQRTAGADVYRKSDSKGNSTRDRHEEPPEFADRVVAINRVSKTVKGGKRFSFAALVVVGDQRGRVGFGKGNAKEVPEAIRKATEEAKRQMIRVPLRDSRTLHHDMEGHHGAGKVVMRSAVAGTGIIAGGPMRAVFEMLGIQDVVAKSVGSRNPHNLVRATMDGLKGQSSPRQVARRRGKKIANVQRWPEVEVVRG